MPSAATSPLMDAVDVAMMMTRMIANRKMGAGDFMFVRFVHRLKRHADIVYAGDSCV